MRGMIVKIAGLGSLLSVAMASVAAAAGTTYDVSPVTTGVTDQLTAALPVILPIAGALLALGIAVRLVRRFVKA